MPLRDDILTYQSQHQCIGPYIRKRLLIRTPVAVVESVSPTGIYLDLFDTTLYTGDDTTDYIYLRILPDYDQENDNLGEGGLRNTFSSPGVYAVSTVRRGFRATVSDRRRVILDIIRRLIDISKSSSYIKFAPIKVIDFCLPEFGASIFNGELATVRWGEIITDNLPGLTGKGYLKADWNFTFKEAPSLRLS
ncbi:MAG: hypothetical protein AB1861_20870 [Cyanobacteriota bacterium]